MEKERKKNNKKQVATETIASAADESLVGERQDKNESPAFQTNECIGRRSSSVHSLSQPRLVRHFSAAADQSRTKRSDILV